MDIKYSCHICNTVTSKRIRYSKEPPSKSSRTSQVIKKLCFTGTLKTLFYFKKTISAKTKIFHWRHQYFNPVQVQWGSQLFLGHARNWIHPSQKNNDRTVAISNHSWLVFESVRCFSPYRNESKDPYRCAFSEADECVLIFLFLEMKMARATRCESVFPRTRICVCWKNPWYCGLLFPS